MHIGAYSGRLRPNSIVSSSSNPIESAWRQRQTIKRGVTRKVRLTNGNFIAEYAVPTPVYSAIEARFSSVNTSEFSSVSLSTLSIYLYNYLN